MKKLIPILLLFLSLDSISQRDYDYNSEYNNNLRDRMLQEHLRQIEMNEQFRRDTFLRNEKRRQEQKEIERQYLIQKQEIEANIKKIRQNEKLLQQQKDIQKQRENIPESYLNAKIWDIKPTIEELNQSLPPEFRQGIQLNLKPTIGGVDYGARLGDIYDFDENGIGHPKGEKENNRLILLYVSSVVLFITTILYFMFRNKPENT